MSKRNSPVPFSDSTARPFLAATLLAAVGVAVYSNSFQVPFVFDGIMFVTENPLVQQLWAFKYGPGLNRPVGFFTFALNYAADGYNVRGYHAVNLAIHVASAWLLFDIVRRTLSGKRLGERLGMVAWGLALAVALVWIAHPLETGAVTYLYQRLEALMALFYLATLWCFLRALASARPGGWYAASVVCCALGMGTKEVMISAPLVVLWYDRVFAADSWREVFAKRGKYYAALAGTWGILASLLIADRGDFVGSGVIDVKGVSSLEYALNQPAVILHYLRLSFWPDELCLDYGWRVATNATQLAPSIAAIAALLALTIWAAWRWPAWGFLGGCFFLILAPTSSVIPLIDLAFEHRMYLPLAVVVCASVLGVYLAIAAVWPSLALKDTKTPSGTPSALRFVLPALVAVVVAMLGCRTFRRNGDYQTTLSISELTARQQPDHARARLNLGRALMDKGDFARSIDESSEAIRLRDDYADAWYNRGFAHAQRQEVDLAIKDFSRVIELRANDAMAYLDRGNAYQQKHAFERAIADYTRAIDLSPDAPALFFNRGTARLNAGKLEQAAQDLTTAVQLDPNNQDFKSRLAECYARIRREQADRQKP